MLQRIQSRGGVAIESLQESVYNFRCHGREDFVENKYLSKGFKNVWKRTRWISRETKTRNIINTPTRCIYQIEGMQKPKGENIPGIFGEEQGRVDRAEDGQKT